jgi:hypothetical protein
VSRGCCEDEWVKLRAGTSVIGFVMVAVLAGCALVPSAPVHTQGGDPESAPAAVVAQLEELAGVDAHFEVREVATYEKVLVTANLDELSEDLLLEVAEIARGSLAQTDTGYRTRVEVYVQGDLVFDADGLKPMDDQLPASRRHSVPFCGLRSHWRAVPASIARDLPGGPGFSHP